MMNFAAKNLNVIDYCPACVTWYDNDYDGLARGIAWILNNDHANDYHLIATYDYDQERYYLKFGSQLDVLHAKNNNSGKSTALIYLLSDEEREKYVALCNGVANNSFEIKNIEAIKEYLKFWL